MMKEINKNKDDEKEKDKTNEKDTTVETKTEQLLEKYYIGSLDFLVVIFIIS